MSFEWQPILENARFRLEPLAETDFEALYAVASDPRIWEQHPNPNRWQREVFSTFFEGAMKSGGAFRIVDKDCDRIIGSTRFYNYDGPNDSVQIGYTFYAAAYWGSGANPAVKALMLDHAFRFVSQVYFHIGACNVRSQIAIGRLGAQKVAEEDLAYFGEPSKPNFIYRIAAADWHRSMALGAAK